MNNRERNDLLISWLTISLAFAWVFSSFNLLGALAGTDLASLGFISLLPIALIVTGTGFVFHEMAHRAIAKRFGCHAEFRMWPYSLLLMLALALGLGVVFAAPGAVYIYGENISRRQNGLISVSGPATNIAVGIAFLLLLLVSGNGFIALASMIGFQINLWLAFFNLLPVAPLDGSKVFAWNTAVWALMFIPLALVLFVL
ncbi:MAG: site-2 protease family protein [Candidatus Diapherotrites archaeon]